MEVLSLSTEDVRNESMEGASQGDDEVEDGELLDDDLSDSDEKLQLRAKRFGISAPAKKHKNKRIARLHKQMGVNSETRTEALHLYGTDTMKSEDVFEYFEGYPPASVEWLTAKACNVVWLDEESCAEALLKNSVRIIPSDREEPTEPEEEYIKEEDLRCALPPGIWRKGRANFMAPSLFMRFATFSDKKGNQIVPGRMIDLDQHLLFPDQGDEVLTKRRSADDGNPWSGIAREWGHFERRISQKLMQATVRDAREVIEKREILKPVRPVKPLRDARELISSSEIPDWESNRSNKRAHGPRMKMRADIEEEITKQKTKNFRNVTDLREKLGKKRKLPSRSPSPPVKTILQIEIDNTDGPLLAEIKEESSSDSSSEESDSEDNDDVVPQEEVSSKHSDLREKLKGSSISTIPKIPLRIEIDNDLCKRRRRSDD